MPTHRSIRSTVLFGLAGALLALGLAPTTAHAQVPTCLPTALVQRDMAGVWTGTDGAFVLTVNPCGGTLLQWRNDYGVNGSAAYTASSRLNGGGYIATIYFADPIIGTPWGTQSMIYKPGVVSSPPQIQVMFMALGTAAPLRVFHAKMTAAGSSAAPV